MSDAADLGAGPARTFRRPLGGGWFLRQPSYFLYMVRELTVVFMTAWLVWFLYEVLLLKQNAFIALTGNYAVLAFSAVCLLCTLYHAVTHDGAKRVFRVLDHGAIFLLIAGTYTPFTLGIMRGPWGWTLFGLVWALAVFGLTTKAIFGAHHRWLTVPLYLVMGWLAVIAAPQILFRLPLPALIWLLAGGFAYTAGVLCFRAHAIRYSHFAWHLFVIAGTVCHFFAVLWYSA